MSIQEKTERQHWMSVLAKAEFAQLKAHWANLKLVLRTASSASRKLALLRCEPEWEQPEMPSIWAM